MNEKIRLKREWFNPLYFHLRKYIDDPVIREILVFGGKSSAKTLTIAQLLALFGYSQGVSSLIYRKEMATVRTTIKNAVDKAIQSIHFDSAYTKMDMHFRCATGAEIPLKGLDNEGKIKGIEGYKYLMFDELDHFEEDEWLQANASLRGMPGQKLFATWNPVSLRSWIKTNLIDQKQWDKLPLTIDGTDYTTLSDSSEVKISKDGHTLLIKTSYHDNKWVVGGSGYGYRDENLIAMYEDRSWDTNWYRVNVLGEWGIPEVDRPWMYAFDGSQLNEGIVLNPRLPVYLSFDFNINPMTCTAHQFQYPSWYHTLYEFRSSNTGTAELCRQIKGSPIGGCHFIVTGDATGRSRTALGGNMNNYTLIANELGLTTGQMKVPASNPKHTESRPLSNSIMARFPNRAIHPRCKYLIADLESVEGDDNDSPKPPSKDMGHLLDTLRYMDYSFMHRFILDSVSLVKR